MRRTPILAAVLAASLTSLAAAQTKPSTVVGELKLHTLKFLDKDRTIRVWLPPGYDPADDRRYPVLYMHDGQNCFDNATAPFGEWKIDETLTRLAKTNDVNVPIVVGIDHGGDTRIAELTYTQDQGRGGNGAQFEQFVVATVVPFVEAAYRVRTDRESTIIGGSSLGATMALELARRHPEKFGQVLAMSPSLWWDRQFLTRTIVTSPEQLRNTTVWIDMGEREGPVGPSRAALVDMARRFDVLLTAIGVRHQLTIDPIGEHNEAAWARRFPAAIQYLLPPRPPATTTTAPANPD